MVDAGDRVVNDFVQRMQPRARVLYHYTGVEGFRGILTTRGLRMTAHNKCAADPGEFHHADNVIGCVAYELGGAGDALAEEAQRLRAKVDALSGLTCFTTKRDSAAHWRRFSRNGPGYAMGFRLLRDETLSLRDTPHFARADLRVTYAPCERFPALLGACHRVLWVYERGLPRRDAVSAIARLFEYTAMTTKTPCDAEEQETRSIAVVGLDAPPTVWEGTPERPYICAPLRPGGRLPVLHEVLVHGGDLKETRTLLQSVGYRGSEMPRVAASRADAQTPPRR